MRLSATAPSSDSLWDQQPHQSVLPGRVERQSSENNQFIFCPRVQIEVDPVGGVLTCNVVCAVDERNGDGLHTHGIRRKWPLKHRLRDYGAIQVSAGYGGSEQLPLQQTDVCAQETATLHSRGETAHSGRRAAASLLERIQFGRLQCCYDG